MSLLAWLILGITGQIAVGAVGVMIGTRDPLQHRPDVGLLCGPRVSCSGYLPRSPFLTESIKSASASAAVFTFPVYSGSEGLSIPATSQRSRWRRRGFDASSLQLFKGRAGNFGTVKPQPIGVGDFSCPMISDYSILSTGYTGRILQRRYSESTTYRGVGTANETHVANTGVTGRVFIITVIGRYGLQFHSPKAARAGTTVTSSPWRSALATVSQKNSQRAGDAIADTSSLAFGDPSLLMIASIGHGTGWFVESPERTHLTFERSIIAPVPPQFLPHPGLDNHDSGRLLAGVRAGQSQRVETRSFGGAAFESRANAGEDPIRDPAIVSGERAGRDFLLKLQNVYRKPGAFDPDSLFHLAASSDRTSLAQISMSQTKELL